MVFLEATAVLVHADSAPHEPVFRCDLESQALFDDEAVEEYPDVSKYSLRPASKRAEFAK